MMQYGLTLTSFLARAGKFFPGVEVISRLPDNSIRRSTCSDLYRRARALGASLQHAGLKKGDRVATLLENRAEQVVTFFAALGGGFIAAADAKPAKKSKKRSVTAEVPGTEVRATLTLP